MGNILQYGRAGLLKHTYYSGQFKEELYINYINYIFHFRLWVWCEKKLLFR